MIIITVLSSLAGQWKPTTAAATESVAGTVCAVELELPEVNPRRRRMRRTYQSSAKGES